MWESSEIIVSEYGKAIWFVRCIRITWSVNVSLYWDLSAQLCDLFLVPAFSDCDCSGARHTESR